jgi:hypothetical protein
MKWFKGNYVFLFGIQFLSGFWTYYACVHFGLIGVGYGFIPFLLAMILVQPGYEPDERELSHIHKTDSIQGIVVATLMAIVYIWFPGLNWFYVFVSSISVIRGAVGMGLFLAG